MSSSAAEVDEAPDLVCQLDSVQGMVDALSSVRWKRHQDAVVELSEHGIVLIVEETGCLQAKVYLKRDLFVSYEYNAKGRPRFGLSLGLFVDCLNTFSSPGHSPVIEIRYPGPDMQLVLKSVDTLNVCIYAEIRTRIPDTISWDYNFGPTRNAPVSFTIKTAALKEAIDDLEWPGSAIQILLQPDPPSVVFKGEGHGDLQIEVPYYANADLLIGFQCDHQVSYSHPYIAALMTKFMLELNWILSFYREQFACMQLSKNNRRQLVWKINSLTRCQSYLPLLILCRYKYKFLRATTSNIAGSVLKDNRGSKLTFGRSGMLKIQHLVSVKPGIQHSYSDSVGLQHPTRIAYLEFYVKQEEDEGLVDD